MKAPVVVAALLVALPAVAALPGAGLDLGTAAPAWASADDATIHPGVNTDSGGQSCTANFLFTAGSDVYIGQAAHCSGLSGSTQTNGCQSGVMAIGTAIGIDGASKPGTLAYSSWNAMQAAGETDGNACSYNDFALIRLHPDDVARANPSVPFFGGPNGVGGGLSFGTDVYSYQNSILRFGIELLKPKQGVSLGDGGSGWSHATYTATPGIPGDSGSGLLGPDGKAVGVLSTVAIAPLTGSNNYADLAHAMAYARAHGLPDLALVDGTEPFVGGYI